MPPQPDPDSSDEGVPPLTENDSKSENILDGDEEDDDDEESNDEPLWNSGMLKCKSLFDSEEFESAEECLEYCQKVHNFNIKVMFGGAEPSVFRWRGTFSWAISFTLPVMGRPGQKPVIK